MTDTLAAPSQTPGLAAGTPSRPLLPLLVILFIGSGCAALIYEIVWLQMLGLVVGASAISLGVLLGTFMGGMCIGSLLLPKFFSNRIHPLLLYGLLEGAIGLIGLLELVLVPFAGDLYTHFAEPGGYAVALRAVMAGICLLPPTILMGATLPAIARYVESSPRGVSWLGFFYGGNTLGAVVGCLLASWWLLPFHDGRWATICAAVINFSVCGAAVLLSLLSPHVRSETKSEAPAASDEPALARTNSGAWAIYIAIGLSGLTGLGSEVVWTRQLSLMLGATVYTFSNILAVFLLGLGIGSSVGSFIARSVRQPKVALAWCQLLLAGAIAWAAYAISYSLPFWPMNPGLAMHPSYTFQANLAECFWAVLPGSLLWGASFPIALAAVARKGQDPGKLVGGMYAANTVGAIVGSLIFSMLVMQYLGSQNAQRLLVLICAISGIVAAIPVFASLGKRDEGKSDQSFSGRALSCVAVAAGALGALLLVTTIDPPNWSAVAWGRNSASNMPYSFPGKITEEEYSVLLEANNVGMSRLRLVDDTLVFEDEQALKPEQRAMANPWVKEHESTLKSILRKRELATGTAGILAYDERMKPDRYCVYLGEGMNVSVAVTLDNNGWRYFHGAGKVQASSNPEDMRLQRSLGHISALTNYAQTGKTPKDVLVVACGAGVTAGSFVPYDCNITIVDIEPMVPQYVTPQFRENNHHVIPPEISGDPKGYTKTKVVIDDGRHFIRTVKTKYDVITSDPIDPWVKGCASLNTVEYYQMCKDHLNPGGVMALWIPFYESSDDTTKSVIATFFKVFPNGIVWSNDIQGAGYDAVLFGSVDKDGKDGTLQLNMDKVQEYLDMPEHAFIKRSLQDVKFGTSPIPGSCEAVELFAMYAGSAPRMGPWIEDAYRKDLINYDRNLRLQYVAGKWVNNNDQVLILNNILRNYSFPDEIFGSSSPDRINALKQILESTGRHERVAPVAPVRQTP